jgi:hypothetical protein
MSAVSSVEVILWIGSYCAFSFWNRQALGFVGLVFTVTTMQYMVGTLWGSLLWLIKMRKSARVDSTDILVLVPVGIIIAIAYVTELYAMLVATSNGTNMNGAVFITVAKCFEPIVVSIISSAYYGRAQSMMKWVSLMFAACGLIIATVPFKENTINMNNYKQYFHINNLNLSIDSKDTVNGVAIMLLSNVLHSISYNEIYKILNYNENSNNGYNLMEVTGENGKNIYTITHILSTLVIVPVMIYQEKEQMMEFIMKIKMDISAIIGSSSNISSFPVLVILSGISLYYANQYAFCVLRRYSPPQRSILNNLKIALSMIVLLYIHESHEGIMLIIMKSNIKSFGLLLCVISTMSYMKEDVPMSKTQKIE